MDNLGRIVTPEILMSGDTLHLEAFDFEYELIGITQNIAMIYDNKNNCIPVFDLGNGNFEVASFNTAYGFEFKRQSQQECLPNAYLVDGMYLNEDNELVPLIAVKDD